MGAGKVGYSSGSGNGDDTGFTQNGSREGGIPSGTSLIDGVISGTGEKSADQKFQN